MEILLHLKSKLRLISVIAVIGLLLGLATSYFSEATYTHRLLFSVTASDEGGGGGISSIVASLGLTGAPSTGELNPIRILAVAKTKLVVASVMQEEILHEGITISSKLMELYPDIQWGNAAELNNKLKQTDSKEDNGKNDLLEETILRTAQEVLMGDQTKEGIIKGTYDRDTELIELSATTKDSTLGYSLVKSTYEALQKYYSERAIIPQQRVYQVAKSNVDSLRRIMANLEKTITKTVDNRQSILGSSNDMKIRSLERELGVVTMAYGKGLENEAFARYALQTATPAFVVVEEPYKTVEPEKVSMLKAGIIGCFLATFLSTIALAAGKIYTRS